MKEAKKPATPANMEDDEEDWGDFDVDFNSLPDGDTNSRVEPTVRKPKLKGVPQHMQLEDNKKSFG